MTFDISRRDFLKTSAASIAFFASGAQTLHSAFAQSVTPRELWLLCDTSHMPESKETVLVTNPGSIKILDVLSGKISQINIPFFGHTLTQNPAKPYQVATFEKWGRRGALVDLKNMNILASAEAAENNTFFGHAVYLSGGSVLAATEDNYNRTKGQLVLRDATNLKIIQKLSTGGTKPHDCHVMEDGQTVMTINQAKGCTPPHIVWIDTISGKLVNRVDFEIGSLLGHFDTSYDGWRCATGFRIKGDAKTLIVLVSPDGRVINPKIPENISQKMHGEGLSVAFLGKSGLVAVTMPHSNMVAILDYKKQEFICSADIKNPNGILSLNNSDPQMIVTSGKDRDLLNVALDSSSQMPTITVANAEFGGLGSHFVCIFV